MKEARAKGNRMSNLPITQYCSGAGVLGAKYGAGRAAITSSAFHARAAEQENAGALLAQLTDEELEEIDEWETPGDAPYGTDGDLLRYAEAKREFTLHLTKDGGATEDPTEAVSTGHPDMAWVGMLEVEGEELVKVAFIGDMKKTDYSSADGLESLQLMAYGFAYAAQEDCDAFCVGIWNITLGEWDWGQIITTGLENADLLERVVRAATNTDGTFVTGGHCRNCYQRTHCQEYLLPVQDPEAALYPLSQPGGLNKDNAPKILDMYHRAKKLLGVVEEQLKAHSRDVKGITNEEGTKVWRETLTQGGKTTLDKTKLVKHVKENIPELAQQFEYTTQGGKPSSFRWCNPPKAKKEKGAA